MSTESATPARDTSLAKRRIQTEAFLNFARIERALERRVSELLADRGLHNVTPAQANLLMILFEQRTAMTARVLAQRMELSAVTVGRFVKALLTHGWVDRDTDPDDSRALLIRPTAKAYRALPRFIEVSNSLLDQAFAGFGDEAIHRIVRTVRRVRDNLNAG